MPRTKENSAAVAETLLTHIVPRFGLPLFIHPVCQRAGLHFTDHSTGLRGLAHHLEALYSLLSPGFRKAGKNQWNYQEPPHKIILGAQILMNGLTPLGPNAYQGQPSQGPGIERI